MLEQRYLLLMLVNDQSPCPPARGKDEWFIHSDIDKIGSLSHLKCEASFQGRTRDNAKLEMPKPQPVNNIN